MATCESVAALTWPTVVFMADAQAGRAMPVTAADAEQANAKVVLERTGVARNVLPAEDMKGRHRGQLASPPHETQPEKFLLGSVKCQSSLRFRSDDPNEYREIPIEIAWDITRIARVIAATNRARSHLQRQRLQCHDDPRKSRRWSCHK